MSGILTLIKNKMNKNQFERVEKIDHEVRQLKSELIAEFNDELNIREMSIITADIGRLGRISVSLNDIIRREVNKNNLENETNLAGGKKSNSTEK